MSHEYQLTKEIEIEASVEDVWDAIATGPGIDAWFIGHSEVEPGVGNAVTFSLGDYFTTSGTVTQWDPPKRFAYRSAELPDGSFMTFDYVVEGRDSGGAVLRMVQSGVLGDDGWEAEYNALDKGWELHLHNLSQYIEHFRGAASASVYLEGAVQAADEDTAWTILKAGLGLSGQVSTGDQVRLDVPGVPPVEGVVDYVCAPTAIGVRTDDGLYRFAGNHGSMGVGHHIFTGDVDVKKSEEAWQSWLSGLYA